MGDVIVGGVTPPPGATIWEQSRALERDHWLREFVLNEPRGGVFRHVNLLVPAIDERAATGWIIMEPEHNPPMSGSNSMCVATVLLETGLVEMNEPVTSFAIEAPAGLVEVEARCREGKAESITVRNLPSFAGQLDVSLSVEGLGTLRVDTAYGGDTFVMVDAADIGVELVPDQAATLVELGRRITRAANEQLSFLHPEHTDWSHFSFCQIASPLEQTGQGTYAMRNTVVIDPGKLDRSPTGTGVSARLALLHRQGTLGVGDRLTMSSIIDSTFEGVIEGEVAVADIPAVSVAITGRAWITGTHQYLLDPDDPWPGGYRIADTWPRM